MSSASPWRTGGSCPCAPQGRSPLLRPSCPPPRPLPRTDKPRDPRTPPETPRDWSRNTRTLTNAAWPSSGDWLCWKTWLRKALSDRGGGTWNKGWEGLCTDKAERWSQNHPPSLPATWYQTPYYSQKTPR